MIVATTTGTIDVLDDNSSMCTKVDCWMTIGSTQLYSSDRSCIRSSEWLNDRVIFAAEELQNPILQTGSFENEKQQHLFRY